MDINAILRIIPADALIAVVLLAVEAVFWIGAGDTPPQARFYPRILVACAAVLTLAMLYRALRERTGERDDAPVIHRQVLAVVLITLAYIVSVEYLGYLIATFLFILATMVFLGVRDKLILLTVPIVSAVLMFLLFNDVLYVMLPKGVIMEFFGL